MKKILVCIILFFSCGEDIREEVIDRYSNGNKKTFVTYKGKGKDEQIVNRVKYYKNGNVEKDESFTSNKTSEKEYYENGNLNRSREYSSDKKLVFEEIYYSSGILARKFTAGEDIYYDINGEKFFSSGKNSYLTDRLNFEEGNSLKSGISRGLLAKSGVAIDYKMKVVTYNRFTLGYYGEEIDNILEYIIHVIIFNEIKLLGKFRLSFDELISNLPNILYSLDGGRGNKKIIKVSKEDIKDYFNECIKGYIAKIHEN